MQRTKRREFLLAAAALAAAPGARARPARIRNLGLLYPNPSVSGDGDARVRTASWLAEIGWRVGDDLDVVHVSADGREQRLPGLAEQLVRTAPDVIWAGGVEAAVSAARATQTIPIVFYGVGFPVEHGLVDSLARPGRNVTGLTSLAGIEWVKALEALREIAPAAHRVAWIHSESVMRTVSGRPFRGGRAALLNPAATKLGFQIERHRVWTPENLDAAFAGIRSSGPDALACDLTAMTYRERHRIVDFANSCRLVSVFGASPFIEAGGLLSYGASRERMARHSFTFVDRILRGARPQDLPVERPTQFELFINLKTARTLGLAVPKSLLLQADRLID